MRRWQTVLLAVVMLGATACDLTIATDGTNSEDGTPPDSEFSNPTDEEEGEIRTCQSAGVSCMVSYENEDYLALYEGTLEILDNPDASDGLVAEALIFNIVAALRLGLIDVETAENELDGASTDQLDANAQGVLHEGLLEVYVLLDDAEKSAEVVAEADQSVIERFYFLRPDLVAHFERLVPNDLFDQPPLAPSG